MADDRSAAPFRFEVSGNLRSAYGSHFHFFAGTGFDHHGNFAIADGDDVVMHHVASENDVLDFKIHDVGRMVEEMDIQAPVLDPGSAVRRETDPRHDISLFYPKFDGNLLVVRDFLQIGFRSRCAGSGGSRDGF